MRQYRQKKKKGKVKEIVLKHIKIAELLIRTTEETHQLLTDSSNQNDIELKKIVADLATKEKDKMKDYLIWDIQFLDKNCFIHGSSMTSGIAEYPLESFQGTLKIKIENQLHSWLTIKKSNIVDTGFGVFAARQFKKDKFIE